MARGLSDLQRYIVTKAATVERLYTHDILQEYYGWTSHIGTWHKRDGTYTPGDQRFWPEEIGAQRYHATRVTLSRAIARLQQRGLVQALQDRSAHGSGVEITAEGRRLAETWQQTAQPGSLNLSEFVDG